MDLLPLYSALELSQDSLELLRDELDDAIELFREDQASDRSVRIATPNSKQNRSHVRAHTLIPNTHPHTAHRPSKMTELLLYQPMPYLENHVLPVFTQALRNKVSSTSWAEWVDSQNAKHESSRAAARTRAEARAARAPVAVPTQAEMGGDGDGGGGGGSKGPDSSTESGLMGLMFSTTEAAMSAATTPQIAENEEPLSGAMSTSADLMAIFNIAKYR